MKSPRDLSGDDVVRALRRLGTGLVRQVGAHARLVRGPARVPVPMHGAIVPGTLKSILRQAGLTTDELRAAL